MRKNKIVVIGAGLGGIATAIALASDGYSVTIFEKNKHVGGKLNRLIKEGFSFDLGPSILTMPHIFKDLFAIAGKKIENYVSFESLDIHWRNRFEDGTVIDLVSDYDKQKMIFKQIDSDSAFQFTRFLNYAQNQYRIINNAFLQKGSETWGSVLTNLKFRDLFSVDSLRVMHKSVNHYFTNRYLRTIFDYFVKYIGSSAYHCPGFLNLLSWIQYGYGLWYIKGGMFNLSLALYKLLNELQVKVFLENEITEIIRSGNVVKGVRCANRQIEEANVVVSNMEVVPVYKRLLHKDPKEHCYSGRLYPSCSGLVIHLGVDRIYPQLTHHNFLYSTDPKDNFTSVFSRKTLPHDPTLYLVAPVRTDSSLAPPGCDILKILPHIPHLNERHHITTDYYFSFKEQVFDKCERMGLTDLRKHIVIEDVMTPVDIQNLYYSNKGSIYGVESNILKNYAFKAPRQSRIYKNLFFTGGSVNPGGGMPMAVLGGIHTAEHIQKLFPKNPG